MCLDFLFDARDDQASESDNSKTKKLNILLTNGRFPVTIDLARQLHRTGHHVYVVDPMRSHVCRFSGAVSRSYHVPAPAFDATGYIEGVKKAVQTSSIDLIIPLHEEIFYLARCGDPDILGRMFAPPADLLFILHDKYLFGLYLERRQLDRPEAHLIKSMEDVKQLDLTREWALKPVFGRASSNVYHLMPGEPLPEDANVGPDTQYVAQEWLKGSRFCSYSVVVKGKIRASVVYPVQETLDGSSCVYFEATDHSRIQQYILKVVEGLGPISGQLAFDFIDTEGSDLGETREEKEERDGHGFPARLVAIECNPRATSGIHLWSGTPHLANVFTSSMGATKESTAVATGPPVDGEGPTLAPRPTEIEGMAAPFPHGAARQVAPGMLMGAKNARTTWGTYFDHMKRLTTTKDATFSWRDLGPTIMQPFLLTSYYEICRERGGMPLADMFQSDLVWEVSHEELERVREDIAKYETVEPSAEAGLYGPSPMDKAPQTIFPNGHAAL